MTDSNYQGIASMAIPGCADPAGTWQQFLNDASTASGDISGTSQADMDVQTVENDFAGLNQELETTALGVQIQAPWIQPRVSRSVVRGVCHFRAGYEQGGLTQWAC